MAKYEHTYRCGCVDWSENPILEVSDKEKPPYHRQQHFQLRVAVGVNPGCQRYLTCLKTRKVADTFKLDTSAVPVRKPVLVNVDDTAMKGVVLAPKLLTHVLAGELNDGKSVGYHSRARSAQQADRIRDFAVLSKQDGLGIYYAEFKVREGVETGTRKVSAFFPDRMVEREIERAIRIAFINRIQMAHSSVNWAGRYENGMVIGGRSDATGIVSAFPAWKSTFDVPKRFLDG